MVGVDKRRLAGELEPTNQAIFVVVKNTPQAAYGTKTTKAHGNKEIATLTLLKKRCT